MKNFIIILRWHIYCRAVAKRYFVACATGKGNFKSRHMSLVKAIQNFARENIL